MLAQINPAVFLIKMRKKSNSLISKERDQSNIRKKMFKT